MEASGTVDDTGERVCALLGGGGHAEYVAAPAGQVFPAPAHVDLVAAAGIPEAFLTAFVNLVVEGRGDVAPGRGVLVHAGASGVGLAAIQVAKLCGARVAATTRTAAKLGARRGGRRTRSDRGGPPQIARQARRPDRIEYDEPAGRFAGARPGRPGR